MTDRQVNDWAPNLLFFGNHCKFGPINFIFDILRIPDNNLSALVLLFCAEDALDHRCDWKDRGPNLSRHDENTLYNRDNNSTTTLAWAISSYDLIVDRIKLSELKFR